jgi:hypothetical protein
LYVCDINQSVTSCHVVSRKKSNSHEPSPAKNSPDVKKPGFFF